MKRFLVVLLILFCNLLYAEKEILIVNSYSKGYKWSDDIMEGISSTLRFKDFKLFYEYMDTKKLNSDRYFSQLEIIYKEKYKNKKFDYIITTDDAAFYFMKKNKEKIFGNIPMVFCGLNGYNTETVKNLKNTTGILEKYDIEETIELMQKLNKNSKNIVVINDESVTGNAVDKLLDKSISKFDQLNFIKIKNSSLEEIHGKLRSMPPDTIILFLVYTKDRFGNTFEYNEIVNEISTKYHFPIFSVWDFYLNEGVVGGKMASGYKQGEAVAEIIIEAESWNESFDEIKINKGFENNYYFDYNELKNQGISLEMIPRESNIINYSNKDRKSVLLLNSYSSDFSETRIRDEYVIKALKEEFPTIEIFTEYFDIKRHNSGTYLYLMQKIIDDKYSNIKLDGIITNDDFAYEFALRNKEWKDIPKVFCGVNESVDAYTARINNSTGVIEDNDIKSTIESMIKLQPDLHNIYVVNDISMTGQKNLKAINQVKGYFSDLNFIMLSDISMIELESRLREINKNDAVLLLTFNRDNSNNTFSYDELLVRVVATSNAPIYCAFEIFIGNGAIGGMITSSKEQGVIAGKQMVRVLNGEEISNLPIIKEAPKMYIFDYKIIKKFGLNIKNIPKGSKVINKPGNILEKYTKQIVIVLICFISGFIYLGANLINLERRITQKEKNEKHLKIQAETDPLTRLPNRRSAIKILEREMETVRREETTLTVCYIDVDNLKIANDKYGHSEGDNLIKKTACIIGSVIRDTDYFCRIGGDEFLLIMPKCGKKRAREVWDRIQNSFELNNQCSELEYKIGASAGFAEYGRYNIYASLEEIINIADDEMYVEKSRKKSV